MISKNPHKAVIYWLLTGCALVYIMVVVGCITRLTHSGLSITDWSFMGSMPPLSEEAWLERFTKYQQSPEFIKVNFTMKLDEFKHIFFWEYIHRMIGRIMMYVFSIGLIVLVIRKKIDKKIGDVKENVTTITKEIHQIDNNITIVKKQTNEKVNSVDNIPDNELELFFTNKYENNNNTNTGN